MPTTLSPTEQLSAAQNQANTWKQQQIAAFNGDMKKFNREFGNCCFGATKVLVKHQDSEEWQELTIRELWNRLQSDGEAYRNNSTNYLVYTPKGGKWFKGIRRVTSEAFIEVKVEGHDPILVTPKHRFMKGKTPINAQDLKQNDLLSTFDGQLSRVEGTCHIYEKDYAYDLTNVGDDSVYYTNRILSHNCFEGSTYTLIQPEVIAKFKEFILSDKWFKPEMITIEGGWQWNQWFKPEKDHCYIVGADVSDGVGKDASVVLVFDITTSRKIQLVASFSGQLSTIEFTYVLVKIAKTYNTAPIAIESNGIGRSVLDSLVSVYEYDNLVNVGGVREGIESKNSIKSSACRWLRDLLKTPEVSIEIYDKNLIAEMEYFERSENGRYEIYKATGTKHDDFMMSFVWAMYCLTEEVIEYLFDVHGKYETIYKIPLHEKITSWGEMNISKQLEQDEFAKFDRGVTGLDDVYKAMKKGKDSLVDEKRKNSNQDEEESYSFMVTGDDTDNDSFFKWQ